MIVLIKRNILIAVSVFLVFFVFSECRAGAQYQEKITKQGKVITGIDKEEALVKFGKPAAVNENIWYYSYPDAFYVYFPATFSVYLYPKYAQVQTGVPLELKSVISSAGSGIRDVTLQAKLLLSEPENFEVVSPGLVIPQKAGSFQIFAIYKDVYSNPAYLTVTEPLKLKNEIIISIDVLPNKPKVAVEGKINFLAFATFVSPQGYYIREISKEAEWFIEQDNRVTQAKDYLLGFASAGTFSVFCKYRDKKSFPQEVEVIDRFLHSNHNMKHLKIIPEYLTAHPEELLPVRVFATYYDNTVVDVTNRVHWDISDTKVIKKREGNFFGDSEGITELAARFENLNSLPTKITIIKADILAAATPVLSKDEENKPDPDSLLQDIKDNIKKLKNEALRQERLFKNIKLVPGKLNIPLGKEGKLSAFGVRQDDSEEDITIAAKWETQDTKVITVNQGQVKTVSPGEAKVRARYKDFSSDYGLVSVGNPELISISATPENQELQIGKRAHLSATGFFTDSSSRDITSEVSWEIKNPNMLNINKGGEARPLKPGLVKVYAVYSKIKSLQVSINIIRQDYWLAMLILKIILYMFIAVSLVFLFLYFLTGMQKKKLIVLRKHSHNDFIIGLFDNLTRIFGVFGQVYNKSVPPLSYAQKIEKLYSINDKLFVRITQTFEEAKYSSRVMEKESSDIVLKDYNMLLKRTLGQHKKSTLLLGYCLSLIKRVPVFIAQK